MIDSHIYAVLKKGEKALTYAKEAWRLTEEQDLKNFDLGLYCLK